MQSDCWIVLLLLLLLLVPLLLFYLHRLLHYLCLASSYTSEPQYKHVRGMSIFRRHSPRKKNLKTSCCQGDTSGLVMCTFSNTETGV